jgi:hypothetical protein
MTAATTTPASSACLNMVAPFRFVKADVCSSAAISIARTMPMDKYMFLQMKMA